METPEALAIIAAGVFFLVGLLTGVQKYLQIMRSPTAEAHPYVDVCHRAALMYAFASILLAKFAEVSQLSTTVEVVALAAVLFYFAAAILTYFIHGVLKDTDNQLRPPFRMGSMEMSRGGIAFYMWSLVAAEIGGFLVLFYGVLVAVL